MSAGKENGMKMKISKGAKKMAYYIYLCLAALNGAVLASADLSFLDWQFWVVTACLCGAYICGGYTKDEI